MTNSLSVSFVITGGEIKLHFALLPDTAENASAKMSRNLEKNNLLNKTSQNCSQRQGWLGTLEAVVQNKQLSQALLHL